MLILGVGWGQGDLAKVSHGSRNQSLQQFREYKLHFQSYWLASKGPLKLYTVQGLRKRQKLVSLGHFGNGLQTIGQSLTTYEFPIPLEQTGQLPQNVTQLSQLYINNFALIDEATVDFKPGLNVITGESGAGKSILLKALGIACGQSQAEKSLIRLNQQKKDSTQADACCILIAKFKIGCADQIRQHLDEANTLIDVPIEKEIELRREVYLNSRGKCFINNQQVSQKLLQTIGGILVDVNGQNSQLLLKEENGQLDMLDQAGGLNELKRKFQSQYEQLMNIEMKLRKIASFSSESEREHMFNTIQAVEALALRPNEDMIIKKHIEKMETENHCAEKIGYVKNILENEQESGLQMIFSGAYRKYMDAYQQLEFQWDQNQESANEEARRFFLKADEQMTKLNNLVTSICSNIETGLENMQFDQEKYEKLKSRRKKVNDALRKYAAYDVSELIEKTQEYELKLAEWEEYQQEAEELEIVQKELRDQVQSLALSLSQTRQKVAASLEKAIESRLVDLAVSDAKFKVQFSHTKTNHEDGLYLPQLGSSYHPQTKEIQNEVDIKEDRYQVNNGSGVDYVQFLFGSSHDGVLRPLADVASGGETSRLMLAIKGAPALLNNQDGGQTMYGDQLEESQVSSDMQYSNQYGILVLDEIDAGIGARLAQPLGAVLSSMVRGKSSTTHQIICVTHLPQVAQRADWHIKATKSLSLDMRPVSTFETLVDEVARGKELDEMAGEHFVFSSDDTDDRNNFALGNEISKVCDQPQIQLPPNSVGNIHNSDVFSSDDIDNKNDNAPINEIDKVGDQPQILPAANPIDSILNSDVFSSDDIDGRNNNAPGSETNKVGDKVLIQLPANNVDNKHNSDVSDYGEKEDSYQMLNNEFVPQANGVYNNGQKSDAEAEMQQANNNEISVDSQVQIASNFEVNLPTFTANSLSDDNGREQAKDETQKVQQNTIDGIVD